MAKEWSDATDTLGPIAQGLIPNYHPELGEARILYVFVSEPAKKGGRAILGRAKKVSGFNEWALEQDFIIEIALPLWNELTAAQRTAAMDHFLECCTGEENEETNGITWKLREPEIKEFTSILDRHGAWHEELAGFVSVAKKVDLTGFIEEEEEDLNVETSAEAPLEV